MKTIFTALMIALIAGLTGCATPRKDYTSEITEARLAQCVQEAPGRMARAEAGDHKEQYNVGKSLFNGCTEGRVKNLTDAMMWLERSADKDNLAANAFLGNHVYGTNALTKHKSRKDWTVDERASKRYTKYAIAIWEKAGRKGFNDVELGQLMDAVNTLGLIQKNIHEDKEAAAEFYCLSFQVSNNTGGVKAALHNLTMIGKTKADCK